MSRPYSKSESAEFVPLTVIQELLACHLPGTKDAQCEGCTVEGPVSLHQYSVIYRARCSCIPHPLLIKQPRNGVASARQQYDALLLAFRRMKQFSGLRVPTPYPWLLDHGLIVMEWIEAPTIRQLLHNRKSRSSNVISVLEAAGKWLASYNGNTNQQTTTLAVDELLGNITRKMRKHHPRRDAFVCHVEKLTSMADIVRDDLIDLSFAHGDFKPDNLLVGHDEIVGIDINGGEPRPAVLDLAHFLLHLDMHLLDPAGWWLLPRRSSLRSAFLRGYRGHARGVDERSLAWAELHRVLDHYYDRVVDRKGLVETVLLKQAYRICADLRARNLKRVF